GGRAAGAVASRGGPVGGVPVLLLLGVRDAVPDAERGGDPGVLGRAGGGDRAVGVPAVPVPVGPDRAAGGVPGLGPRTGAADAVPVRGVAAVDGARGRVGGGGVAVRAGGGRARRLDRGPGAAQPRAVADGAEALQRDGGVKAG